MSSPAQAHIIARYTYVYAYVYASVYMHICIDAYTHAYEYMHICVYCIYVYSCNIRQSVSTSHYSNTWKYMLYICIHVFVYIAKKRNDTSLPKKFLLLICCLIRVLHVVALSNSSYHSSNCVPTISERHKSFKHVSSMLPPKKMQNATHNSNKYQTPPTNSKQLPHFV